MLDHVISLCSIFFKGAHIKKKTKNKKTEQLYHSSVAYLKLQQYFLNGIGFTTTEETILEWLTTEPPSLASWDLGHVTEISCASVSSSVRWG